MSTRQEAMIEVLDFWIAYLKMPDMCNFSTDAASILTNDLECFKKLIGRPEEGTMDNDEYKRKHWPELNKEEVKT